MTLVAHNELAAAGSGPPDASVAVRVLGTDSAELKRLLRRSRVVQQLKAAALVAPLFIFLLTSFVAPIAFMLSQSVTDTVVAPILPRTIASLADWHGPDLPPDATFQALIEDFRTADADGVLARVATRLNYDMNGFRSLVFKTNTALADQSSRSATETLIGVDRRWGEPGTWMAIRRASGPWTDLNLLAALDLHRGADNSITAVSDQQAIFKKILLRTFVIALVTTLFCLALGFPLALLLASLPPGLANLMMFFVLLPFWTSVLVRTLAWFVLLQREGILNDFMMGLGLTDTPIQFLFTRSGIYISLVHVFLPFMVLPLYSVMKGIPPLYLRAAASLGASPFLAFRRIYLPLALPGISAGCLLVFIQALGIYITPALLGGADDQGIAFMIAFYTNKTIHWGMGAALSLLLLVATLALYAVYTRLVGKQQLQIG